MKNALNQLFETVPLPTIRKPLSIMEEHGSTVTVGDKTRRGRSALHNFHPRENVAVDKECWERPPFIGMGYSRAR